MDGQSFVLVDRSSPILVSVEGSVHDVSESVVSPRVLGGNQIVSRPSVPSHHLMRNYLVSHTVGRREQPQTVQVEVVQDSTLRPVIVVSGPHHLGCRSLRNHLLPRPCLAFVGKHIRVVGQVAGRGAKTPLRPEDYPVTPYHIACHIPSRYDSTRVVVIAWNPLPALPIVEDSQIFGILDGCRVESGFFFEALADEGKNVVSAV